MINGIFVLIFINVFVEKFSLHARIIRRTKNDYDMRGTVNSNVELSCELTNYYRGDVIWRKLEGVSFFLIYSSKLFGISFNWSYFKPLFNVFTKISHLIKTT